MNWKMHFAKKDSIQTYNQLLATGLIILEPSELQGHCQIPKGSSVSKLNLF